MVENDNHLVFRHILQVALWKSHSALPKGGKAEWPFQQDCLQREGLFLPKKLTCEWEKPSAESI